MLRPTIALATIATGLVFACSSTKQSDHADACHSHCTSAGYSSSNVGSGFGANGGNGHTDFCYCDSGGGSTTEASCRSYCSGIGEPFEEFGSDANSTRCGCQSS